MRRNKFNTAPVAERTGANGRVYHSKREMVRAAELQLLERAGKIGELKEQPHYVVADAVEWHRQLLPWGYEQINLEPIDYIADFAYRETGRLEVEVVEDVKGARTPLYLLKRQLFLLRYPGIEFRET